MKNNVYKILRVVFGWIFLWAFLDKTFGLGFATSAESAWINGGSPTYGFLTYATKGPFMDFFQSLAGNVFIDIIFMTGLFAIGLSFIFNKYIRYTGWFAFVMMLLMYVAGFLPPDNNPIIDDHIIYGLLAVYFALGDTQK